MSAQSKPNTAVKSADISRLQGYYADGIKLCDEGKHKESINAFHQYIALKYMFHIHSEGTYGSIAHLCFATQLNDEDIMWFVTRSLVHDTHSNESEKAIVHLKKILEANLEYGKKNFANAIKLSYEVINDSSSKEVTKVQKVSQIILSIYHLKFSEAVASYNTGNHESVFKICAEIRDFIDLAKFKTEVEMSYALQCADIEAKSFIAIGWHSKALKILLSIIKQYPAMEQSYNELIKKSCNALLDSAETELCEAIAAKAGSYIVDVEPFSRIPEIGKRLQKVYLLVAEKKKQAELDAIAKAKAQAEMLEAIKVAEEKARIEAEEAEKARNAVEERKVIEAEKVRIKAEKAAQDRAKIKAEQKKARIEAEQKKAAEKAVLFKQAEAMVKANVVSIDTKKPFESGRAEAERVKAENAKAGKVKEEVRLQEEMAKKAEEAVRKLTKSQKKRAKEKLKREEAKVLESAKEEEEKAIEDAIKRTKKEVAEKLVKDREELKSRLSKGDTTTIKKIEDSGALDDLSEIMAKIAAASKRPVAMNVFRFDDDMPVAAPALPPKTYANLDFLGGALEDSSEA